MNKGERIKNRRKELGLSVEQVAESLNKNRATIYRYENNDIDDLPTTVLESLSKVLKTTPAYLMGWSDDSMDDIYNYDPPRHSISTDRSEELSNLYGKLQSETDETKIEKITRRIKRIEKLCDKAFGYGNEIDDAVASDNATKGVYYLDPDAAELAQEIYEDENMRMLFSATRDISKEDMQFVIDMVERLKRNSDG